ncbi:cytochrome P450 4V2 [Trichonephila clavipes]|nr:cytochrome P450 4V2 [Trichonephila clavipes]
MSFREKSRNGYSVNVFLLQFLGGFSKLFQKQKLFCVWFFCEPVIVLAKAEAVEIGGENSLPSLTGIEKSYFLCLVGAKMDIEEVDGKSWAWVEEDDAEKSGVDCEKFVLGLDESD